MPFVDRFPFVLSSNRKMNERCFHDIFGGRERKKRKGGYYSRELLKTNIIVKNDGGEDVETLNAKSSLSAIYIPPLSSHFSPSLRSSSRNDSSYRKKKKKFDVKRII